VKPFVPAWLDDSDLTTSEFRVLAHLWRRADRSCTCYPAAASICKICHISDNTLWSVLRSLEKKGYLTRSKRDRNSNLYCLAHFDGRPQGEMESHESPQKVGQHSPQNDGCRSPQDDGVRLPQSKGLKGYPTKEIQGREPDDAHSPLRNWPDTIPDDVAEDLAEELGLPLATVRETYSDFRYRKLTYSDPPPSSLDDVWGIFCRWSKTSEPGRKAIAAARAAVASDSTMMPQTIPEPEGWREIIASDDDDGRFANADWEAINPYYQRRIAAKVRGGKGSSMN
jgi:hypothetical protein